MPSCVQSSPRKKNFEVNSRSSSNALSSASGLWTNAWAMIIAKLTTFGYRTSKKWPRIRSTRYTINVKTINVKTTLTTWNTLQLRRLQYLCVHIIALEARHINSYVGLRKIVRYYDAIIRAAFTRIKLNRSQNQFNGWGLKRCIYMIRIVIFIKSGMLKIKEPFKCTNLKPDDILLIRDLNRETILTPHSYEGPRAHIHPGRKVLEKP